MTGRNIIPSNFISRFLLFSFLIIISTINIIFSQYPLDSELGDSSNDTIYTKKLLTLLLEWPPKHESYIDLKNETNYPININCLTTKGDPLYIGVEQYGLIHAPAESVQMILEDFSNYQNLFPGFSDIHLVSNDQNKNIVFWKKKLPFILPDISYEITYLSLNLTPDCICFRLRLKEQKGSILASDTIIVLEKLSTNETAYTEYDFFKADWGIAGYFLSFDDIWQKSVEDIYLSDIMVKFKAEHPDLPYQSLIKAAEECTKQYPTINKIKQRRPVEF